MFKTHLMFSFLLGLTLFKYFDLNPYLFVLIVVLIGILPDIDHSKSFIGRRFFIISWIVNLFFGHRKLIHSLFFAILLTIIVRLFFGSYYIPFFIGYVSHLFLDSLTKQGIRLFYPFKFKLAGFIKTNSLLEKLFLLILFILVIYNLLFI